MKKIYPRKSALLEAKIALYRVLKSEKAEAGRNGDPLTSASRMLLLILEDDPHMRQTVDGFGNAARAGKT